MFMKLNCTEVRYGTLPCVKVGWIGTLPFKTCRNVAKKCLGEKKKKTKLCQKHYMLFLSYLTGYS